MKIKNFARLVVVASMTLALASCTTNQTEFQKNPKGVSKAALCRTYVEPGDPAFKSEIVKELNRRGISENVCGAMVQQQNQAIAATAAIALVGTAVAVCANNNCGSGGGYYENSEWDAFYNQYRQIVWACRSTVSGQFTDVSKCYGKAQTDYTWPGLYA